ncbi:hypothetical protein ACF0H5_005891 [Mactra antiquata]
MPRRFIKEVLSDEEEDELFSYLNSSKIVKPSKLIAPKPQQNLYFNEKSKEIHNSSNLSIKNEFEDTTSSYQPLLDVKTEVITDCIEICDDSTEFVANKVELLHDTDPLTSNSQKTNENCKVNYEGSEGLCESSDDNFGSYEYVYNDYTEVMEGESALNDVNSNFCAPKIVTETSPVCTNVSIDKTLPMQNVFASHMGNVRSGLDDRYYLINEKDWMSLISSLQVNKQSSQVDAFNSSNLNSHVEININDTNVANNESERNSVPGNSSQFTALSDVSNQCKNSPVKDVPLIDEQNVEVIYVKYENGQLKSVGNNSPIKNVIVHSPKKSPKVQHYDINHSNIVQAENSNPTRAEDNKGHSRFVRINNKLSRVFVKDDESFIEQVVNERNELINTSSGISDSDMTDNLSDHGAETAYFIDLEDWNQSEGEGRSNCMIQPINIQDNYYSFVQENQKESNFVAEQLYLQDGSLTIMSDSGTSKPLNVYSPVKVNHGKSNTSPVKSCLKLITLSPCKLVKSPSKNSCPDKTEIRNSSAQIIKNLWKNCKLDNMKQILPGAVNIVSSTSPSVIDIKPISKNYLISSDDDVDDNSDDADDSLVKYMQRGYNKNDTRSKKNKCKNAHSNNSLSTLSINLHENSDTCENISSDEKSVLSSKMKMRKKNLNSSANAKNGVAISEEYKCNLGSKSVQGEVIDMTLDISDDLIQSSKHDSTENKNIRKGNKKRSDMKNKSKAKNSQILDIHKNKSVLEECDSKILSVDKIKRKELPSITDKHIKLKQSTEENSTKVREHNVRRLDSSKKVSKCSEVGKKKNVNKLLQKGKNTDKLNLKFDFNKNMDKKVAKSNAVNNTRHNTVIFNVEKGDCRFKRRNTKRKHTTNQSDLGNAANQEKCSNPICVDDIQSDIKVAKKTKKKCCKKSMAIEADTVNTEMEDVPKKSGKCKKKMTSEESRCDEVKGDMHIDSSELEDISRWRNIKKNKVDFLERLFQMKQKEATIIGEKKATSPDKVEGEIEKTKNITEPTQATVNCNIDLQSCSNSKKGTRRRGRKRKIERLERSLDDEECSSAKLCNVTEKDPANDEDKPNNSSEILDNGSNVTCKTCDLKHPIGETSVSHDNCANNVNKLSSTNDRLSNELTSPDCLLEKGLAIDRKTRKKRRKKKSDSKKMDISSISCGRFKRKKSLKQLTSKTKTVHRPKSDSWKEMLQDEAFKFDFNKDLRKTYKPLNVKELVKKILEPHSDIDIRKREKEKQTFRKRRRSRFKYRTEKMVRQRTVSDNEDTWFSDSGHNISFPAFKFGQTKHQIVQIPENNEEK